MFLVHPLFSRMFLVSILSKDLGFIRGIISPYYFTITLIARSTFGFLYFVDVNLGVEEAIFHDLNLAWYNGYRKVICETDSCTAIQLLSHANFQFHLLLER